MGRYRTNQLASAVVKAKFDRWCPYCDEAIQRIGEDMIDCCPVHGILEGEPPHAA
jgi:hypothetical protein